MRSLSMGITCLAVLCVGWSVKAEELTKQELAARDFSYQGVGFETTCEDFLKKFPNAELQSNDKTGVTPRYAIIENDGRVWSVDFFRGKAYLIVICFPKEWIFGIGGTPVFKKKLTDKFGSPTSIGSPTSTEEYIAVWAFPNVQRRMRCTVATEARVTVIVIGNTAVDEQRIDAQSRKLDLGF